MKFGLGIVLVSLLGVAVAQPVNDDEKYHSTAMNVAVYDASTGTKGGIKVLFVGNSITLHGRADSIGWTNCWGMAASAAEKDYVHLVTAGIEKRTGRKAEVKIHNCAEFERNFRHDNLQWTEPLVAFDPDIFVLAIGENMPAIPTEADQQACREAVKRLLDRFFAGRKTRPRAVIRGVFWPDARKDQAMEQAGRDYAIPLVKCDFKDQPGMDASDAGFSHPGVQAHPGDRGMAKIAERVLQGLFPSAK